jgi:hypothetical protein
MNTGDSTECMHSRIDRPIGDHSSPEIHSMMVVSTAHVTLEEAEALTENGYNRGVFGWLFNVGGPEAPVLSDLRTLSTGLREVIREARVRGCTYVLLDRDADPLDGAPIYDW